MVSIHTLELETVRLVILYVQDLPIMRHRYVVQRTGNRLSPAAQAFRSFVLEQAEQFIRLPAQY